LQPEAAGDAAIEEVSEEASEEESEEERGQRIAAQWTTNVCNPL
jgi:hypothetical protein